MVLLVSAVQQWLLYIYSYLGFFTEKGMVTHFSTLAWKIPWTEEPVGCSPCGHEELDTTEQLHIPFSRSCIGEGNGNALQCSCLQNPRDREPGGLLSMGSNRVRQDWSDSAASVSFLYTPNGQWRQHLFLAINTSQNCELSIMNINVSNFTDSLKSMSAVKVR